MERLVDIQALAHFETAPVAAARCAALERLAVAHVASARQVPVEQAGLVKLEAGEAAVCPVHQFGANCLATWRLIPYGKSLPPPVKALAGIEELTREPALPRHIHHSAHGEYHAAAVDALCRVHHHLLRGHSAAAASTAATALHDAQQSGSWRLLTALHLTHSDAALEAGDVAAAATDICVALQLCGDALQRHEIVLALPLALLRGCSLVCQYPGASTAVALESLRVITSTLGPPTKSTSFQAVVTSAESAATFYASNLGLDKLSEAVASSRQVHRLWLSVWGRTSAHVAVPSPSSTSCAVAAALAHLRRGPGTHSLATEAAAVGMEYGHPAAAALQDLVAAAAHQWAGRLSAALAHLRCAASVLQPMRGGLRDAVLAAVVLRYCHVCHEMRVYDPLHGLLVPASSHAALAIAVEVMEGLLDRSRESPSAADRLRATATAAQALGLVDHAAYAHCYTGVSIPPAAASQALSFDAARAMGLALRELGAPAPVWRGAPARAAQLVLSAIPARQEDV